MSDLEFWLVVATGVGSVLSLIATVISAAGAAKSADTAVQAEKRAAAAESASDARERARLLALLRVRLDLATELVERAASARRGLAVLHGTLGGSRQKLAAAEWDEVLAELKAMKADEKSSLHELDAMLAVVEARKERALLAMEYADRERLASLQSDVLRRDAVR